jgi:FeS assembly SUF system protein
MEDVERDARADSDASTTSAGSAVGAGRTVDDIKYDVIAQLKTVYDPEIPVDIYELGLIYTLEIAEDGAAHVVMTLTTPMCPAAEVLPPEVEAKTREVPGVTSVKLDLVWEPPWSMDMMSPAARLALNV